MNIEAHLPRLIANERAFIDLHEGMALMEEELGDDAAAEKSRRDASKHRARLARLMVEAEEIELEACREA